MFKRIVQYRGPTPDLQFELDILDSSGAGGIPGVAVECVEIRKNTDGEGSLLGTLSTLRLESAGSKQD